MTPVLDTKRLRLLPYRATMATEGHVDWLNDPETTKYSEQRHSRHTLETQRRYLNRFPYGSHIWLIAAGGMAIGSLTAYIDIPNCTADMGILIGDKEAKRKGYGLEAWVEVMRFLSHAGVRKVECGCMQTNFAMRGLARKADMAFEGSRPSHFIRDGAREDLMLYGKLYT